MQGFRYRPGDRRQNATENLPGARWTSGYRYIDRNHRGDPTASSIGLAEYATGAPAVADRNDELRVRRCIVGAAQRHLHILGHRSCYHQQVCVPWTRDEPDTEPLDIVERIIERLNFQLAAVTRPGVYGSNTQRPTEDIENA